MTEENIINTEALESEEPVEAEEAAKASLSENEANEAESNGEGKEPSKEEGAQEAEVLPETDAETFARTLANPMFAVFARGRSTDINTAVRDFLSMMEAGRSLLNEEALMRMTPHSGFSGAQSIALTEAQRKIARDAGMSYREYYEHIRTLPEKHKR